MEDDEVAPNGFLIGPGEESKYQRMRLQFIRLELCTPHVEANPEAMDEFLIRTFSGLITGK
jgi:hypothetical protein